MSKRCDDSVSYEESRGGKNYFAIKKVYEGSFDGETWYRAGDIVYYGDGKKRMLKSIILVVEYDGSVLVENEKGMFSCSVKEIKSGHMALGKASDYPGINLEVKKEKDTLTDKILLSYGNLVDFMITRDGKRVHIDKDGNWSFDTDSISVNQSTDGSVGYERGRCKAHS